MLSGAATDRDVAALVRLHNAAAETLTAQHGHGHWSGVVTEKSVRSRFRNARYLMARDGDEVIGALRLVTKKPWAIDVSYFTPVKRALYLLDMVVAPERQGTGVGRVLVESALREARAFPAQAIRLDAYDAPAGAGGFYARCGFRDVGHVVYRDVPLVYFERLIDGAS